MRPKSPAHRNARLTFRVYSLEKKAIELAADKSGLAVSDYIRRCCLDKTIHPRLSEEELNLYQLLSEYRNNFARISNLIKENKQAEINSQIKEVISNINQHLKKFTA